MTRDEWDHFEKIEHNPDVQFAMRARCEEQGHDWEPGMVFGAGFVRSFMQCKWCRERK